MLVRGAQQALDRPSGPTYRPCFLNPWHGAGRETVSLDSGGEQVEVPVCAPCRRAVTRQEPPEALEVPRRWGGPRRYYEADTVWARTGFGAISDDLWRLVLDDRDGRS